MEEQIVEGIETPIIPTLEFKEEDDMQAFRADPRKACEGMQRKYIGQTYSEYSEYWNGLKSYEGEIGEYQKLEEQTFHNIYTHEDKTIKVLIDLPRPSDEEIIEARIKELKMKLIKKTITAEEKEELNILIG